MMIKSPKGTLLVRKFIKNQPVTPYVRSKKHGHLWLIKAVLDGRHTVVAFYGSYETSMLTRHRLATRPHPR